MQEPETGTGFAGAKLSEILPSARVARFVRMTEKTGAGAHGLRMYFLYRRYALRYPIGSRVGFEGEKM